MSHRLKFRIWFALHKEMIVLDKMWMDDEYSSLAFGSNEERWSGICSLPSNWPDDEEYEFGKNMFVMQSTGLKDNTGRLIFEGDLLKYKHDDGVILEVFYHPEEARYKCSRAHWQGNRCGGFVPDISSPNLEVCGNKYENPELLKEVE